MSASPAPTNDDEARRLAVLHAIGVLGTPAEPSFDALADCAASASGCPVALLNLVDADRVWVKAAVGTSAASLPREQALCTHVVAADAPLEVDDLRRDARFAGHALVAVEGGLRFFAGFPLRVEGRAVGALCVHDRVPRRLDAAQRRTLASLAQAGSELLALRLKVGEVERERARLADFARASGDWMWETDAELRYTWISPTYEAVTGVPARQWLGRRIVDTPLLDAQGRPLPDGATLHALMARPEPYARVLTEQRIGERRLFVLRSAVPVFDAAGALGGWRGTSRDLTARMAVSERAREREDMLAKLAASLPGVVFQYRLHPDGRVSYPYVSSRVREVYGIEPPATDVLHEREQAVRMLLPEDRARFLASIDESARGLTRWVHDYRIVRADGEVRWLESRSIPEPLPDGGILWHGFTADVTERKAMELALRRTEERWELAAEAAGIGRATLDLASGTMEFDRRACLNHGLPWPHAPIAFTAWRDSIDPEQRDAVVRDLERAVTERRTFETRCRVRRPDGELRLIELVARAVVGADGAATSLVGTCRDVTGQAAAEQLRRDKESAERANRAKTE
ncbi:MAG TPA: PAS domain-containing protein, partial [Ideonella sp.]|nr:PAS domain-containing protein [Ideonella sp.]